MRQLARMRSWSWHAGYVMLVLTLMVAPLPLGSNREWAWGPLAVVVGFAALLQATGAPTSRQVAPLASLVPAGIAFGLLVLWVLATSLLPLVPAGATGNFADKASLALNQSLDFPIAARADAALTALMRWLTYALVFWLAVQFANDIKGARALLVAILISGVGMTAYGLLADTAALLKGDIAALFPRIGLGFSGTFINKNNYATFAGLCALIAITLVRMDMPAGYEGDLLRTRLRRLAERLGSSMGLCIAAFVLLVGGVIFSGSRGGTLALVVGLLTIWLLGRRRSLWAVAAVGASAIGLLALPGGLDLLSRFLALATDGAGPREYLYDLTIQGILLRPWTGWGLGSFEALYPVLQPTTLDLFYDKAHNTYLELAFDLGIPFGAVLPLIVLFIVVRCGLGLRERSRNQEVPALAIAATVLVGVHAFFDFSVQIPAIAATYAAVLGVGWAQSWSSRR
jgi:O-antigen ligase